MTSFLFILTYIIACESGFISRHEMVLDSPFVGFMWMNPASYVIYPDKVECQIRAVKLVEINRDRCLREDRK